MKISKLQARKRIMIRTICRHTLMVVVLVFGLGGAMVVTAWPQEVPSPLKTEKSKTLGNYLVDQKGMTLYIFDKDKEAGKSACNGGCANLWAPFAPEAGQAKATEPLSIITRDDGTKQYAYKGKPLYYYDKDSKAGDTRGDAVGKVWWVAKP
jgi:predicted lipoprotein with Yx(FWY)xxD motif